MQNQSQAPPQDGPPPLTEEQIALSDAHFEAVDLKYDAKSGTLSSPTHDLTLLNALSRSLAALPPQIGFPPPPNVLPPQRSMAINQAREQGNAAFKKGEYAEAIKFFTLAIDVAASRPLWESAQVARDELAVCLANRSAVFYQVEDWVNALVDAEAVVQLKKPWLKGHFRKGNALVKLHRYAEARRAYLLGLQFDPDSVDLRAALEKVPADDQDPDDNDDNDDEDLRSETGDSSVAGSVSGTPKKKNKKKKNSKASKK
ncbi:unnamed protein product [Sympodiomycopsis kandeliae]